MFERFTDQARRIVALAQEEARTLNRDDIGTEHILLALIREGSGMAAEALTALGITEEAARQRVEEVTGRGRQGPQRGRIPFTPWAKKALELSLREAMAIGNSNIGTEHILLGLLRVGEGPTAQILAGLGVDQDRVRQQVIKLLSAGRDKAEPGPRRDAEGDGKPKLPPQPRDHLDSLEWRLSILEQRVGTGPELGQLDQEIAQARRDKEKAAAAQDYEKAAVLRDREQHLLAGKAAREQEWAALPSLSDEIERLRELLRRHGIDPQDDVA
jgi:ATP-dependent Clp protease ATP-binding subunit ClpC